MKKKIEEMLAEAEKFAETDKEKRQAIDLTNQAEFLCFETEKCLSYFKENMSEERKRDINKLIENVRQEIKNNNYEDLKLQIKNLSVSLAEIYTGLESFKGEIPDDSDDSLNES